MPSPTSTSISSSSPISSDRAAQVLSQATARTIDLLGLTHAEAARVLGVSRPSVTRLAAGSYVLAPGRGKEWELAALLVRLYRSLHALVGHDSAAQAWLRGPNLDLGDTPIELIGSVQGLLQVLQYVDAHRGRI